MQCLLTFHNIFLHNLFVCTIIVIGGFALGKIFIGVFACYQIILLYLQFTHIVSKIGVVTTLLNTIPHGLFELSAIVLSYLLSARISSCRNILCFKVNVKKFMIYVLIIVSNLLIAAYIEACFVIPNA